jgi:hypothetical protein
MKEPVGDNSKNGEGTINNFTDSAMVQGKLIK